jgi:hypothetical protein
MLDWLVALCFVSTVCLGCATARAEESALAPRSVKVLPVFFVPKGEADPTTEETESLMRHLEWCRTRYREMLGNADTFELAESAPRVYHAENPLAFYREQPEGAAPQYVSELLKAYGFNRYNCPYVLFVVLMNSADGFPGGGGRPLNGGLNTGGGIVILSSYDFDRAPNVQSTVQHELGHAFGLPHVDVYGYDMMSNDSIMSYNPRHHTHGFEPSATPGVLIPEDVRALAMNRRVFGKLRFDPKKDVPASYAIADHIVVLGPMKIPGQPDGALVTTESGEERGSKVANVVQGQILPNKTGDLSVFDPNTMWQSAKSDDGWALVQVVFPYAVELTRVMVYSQYGGRYDAARAVRVAVKGDEGSFRRVGAADMKSADAAVTFPKTCGREWRFEFQPGESGQVVLRGLRFFCGEDELFPPLLCGGG